MALYTQPSVHRNDILRHLLHVFDASNYPEHHPLFSLKNKAKLGCFKDEAAGRKILEFILLRPKMYSMKLDKNEDGIRRAKGVQKCVVEKMSHEDYVKVYEKCKETTKSMANIRSKNHLIKTNSYRKRALSFFDDKRYWLDRNTSVPYGYNGEVPVPPSKRRRVLPPSGDILKLP